jgi:hypothetical protein
MAESRAREVGDGVVKWLVEKLPRDDRSVVDQYLLDHEFRDYDGLRQLLHRRGLDIGLNALHGYGSRLRARREEERAIARGVTLAAAIRGSRRLAKSKATEEQ